MAARQIGLAIALVLVVATACDRASTGDETDSTDPTDSTDAPVAIPGCSTKGTGTFPRRSPRGVSQTALLTAVDITEEGCLDVIRFEFEGPGVGAGLPPGYLVEYRLGPFTVGEGEEAEELDVSGSAFLVVTLESSARSIEGETSGQMLTYAGPTNFVPGGLNQLQEMALFVDAPDQMQWLIGLKGERPFLVDAAAGPPRITIKIA
ncbi:MAG: AMIN-like domain-containing (lipo)protein [Acidimicrobiia bacterium]